MPVALAAGNDLRWATPRVSKQLRHIRCEDLRLRWLPVMAPNR